MKNDVKHSQISIIGAGPGGLAAGMLLAHAGFSVTIYEKEKTIGGRTRPLILGEYSFDLGPTFLTMVFLLDDLFTSCERDLASYIKTTELDPMYRLIFPNCTLEMTTDHTKMRAQIAQHFPGEEDNFDRFMIRETKRLEALLPVLDQPFNSLFDLVTPKLMRAAKHAALGKSLYSILKSYFSDETLCTAFTFQAKYIGMSPWESPGLYAMIPAAEHTHGIAHVEGGLNQITKAMAKVFEEEGGKIITSAPVKQVVTEKGVAVGLELESGEVVTSDAVVLNADFGTAMGSLFAPGVIQKWAPKKLEKKSYSCSTAMFYIGLDTLYDEPHHQLVFAADYKKNVDEVMVEGFLSDDPTLYIHNPSKLDSTLAPKGHSSLYVLVPAPNCRGSQTWDDDTKASLREKILTTIEEKTSMKDVRDHIQVEHMITPKEWEEQYGLYKGSVFNLGHNLSQVLNFRPHNDFEEVENCYLVGGGTHPGSGLPTIFQSGKITAGLIQKKFSLST